jgi:hypothetical protein
MWKLHSVHLMVVLILMQNRCTLCAEHTIDSEIVLDAPYLLLGDDAQVDARFILFGDIANLDSR